MKYTIMLAVVIFAFSAFAQMDSANVDPRAEIKTQKAIDTQAVYVAWDKWITVRKNRTVKTRIQGTGVDTTVLRIFTADPIIVGQDTLVYDSVQVRVKFHVVEYYGLRLRKR